MKLSRAFPRNPTESHGKERKADNMTDEKAIRDVYVEILRKQGEIQHLFENSDCEYGKGISKGLEMAINFIAPIVYKIKED